MIILHQVFCDHCSTIEGESELSRNKHRTIYQQATYLYLHINLHVGDPEATGIDNDNDSISSSDTTLAWGGLETEGNTNELLPSNQAMLTALTRK